MNQRSRPVTNSKHYKEVAEYFRKNLWNESQVRNAVEKNWITAEECEHILKLKTQVR